MNDTKQSDGEYFNGLIETNGIFDPFLPRAWTKLRGIFEHAFKATKSPADRLLDVGCGTGASKQIYDRVVKEYVGIDLSDLAIGVAKQTHPNNAWHVGDACNLQFSSNSFSIVSFSSVLHHIPERAIALREAKRVLKPGGFVFAFDPNVLHPAMALLRHPRSPMYNPVGVSPNEKPLLPRKLRRDFEDAGFEKVSQRCVSGLGYRELGPPSWKVARNVFNALDAAWQRSGLGYFAGLFVVTCAVKP